MMLSITLSMKDTLFYLATPSFGETDIKTANIFTRKKQRTFSSLSHSYKALRAFLYDVLPQLFPTQAFLS